MTPDFDKMYCGAISRGDIFLYKHKDEEKAAVVLQDTVLNGGLPSVVCAPVDFDKKEDEVFANEVLLKKEDTNSDIEGICMLHKIITVDRVNVFERKGSLSENKLKEIYLALDVNLGRFRDYKF